MRYLSLLVLLACLFAAVVKSEIVTVQVTAEITQFEDNGSYFDDSISVGSTLVMTYSYDTESVDSDARDNYGVYYQSLPNVLAVTTGNYTFQSDTEDLDYHIGIVQGQTNDSYNVRSLNNIVSGNTYTDNFEINWQINYDSETLISTALLTTAPDISPLNYIQIGDGRDFYIVATPISIEIIPEPVTLLTLGLGGLFLRIRRK